MGNHFHASSKPADFSFASRAAKYDEGFEGKASRRFYNLLLREVALSPGMSVLDVGCGTGALLARLCAGCDIDAHGIDMEQNMIDVAKNKHPLMDFSLSRCNETPFADKSFDVIVACMAYHHFDNKEGFAKEATRLLKDGGILYIADPRFPQPLRKTINAILRHVHTVGEFNTPDEIATKFSAFGFSLLGVATHGYAQLVKLSRLADACAADNRR